MTSLADSVATLQNCYTRLESHLDCVDVRARPACPRQLPAAAAGSESQATTDATSVAALLNPRPPNQVSTVPDYTLDTAYRSLQEDTSPNSTQGESHNRRTRFGYAAESLPLVETISPSFRQQIISGRDVNLAALFIPYYNGQNDPSYISVDKPDARLTRSLTLSEFILAFGVYKQVMCTVHPHR